MPFCSFLVSLENHPRRTRLSFWFPCACLMASLCLYFGFLRAFFWFPYGFHLVFLFVFLIRSTSSLSRSWIWVIRKPARFRPAKPRLPRKTYISPNGLLSDCGGDLTAIGGPGVLFLFYKCRGGFNCVCKRIEGECTIMWGRLF